MEDKERAINKVIQKNGLIDKGCNIEEIAWLKKRDSPMGAVASLGVRFDNAEAAEWAIRDGSLFGPRYVGSVEAYEKKERSYWISSSRITPTLSLTSKSHFTLPSEVYV